MTATASAIAAIAAAAVTRIPECFISTPAPNHSEASLSDASRNAASARLLVALSPALEFVPLPLQVMPLCPQPLPLRRAIPLPHPCIEVVDRPIDRLAGGLVRRP